MYLKINRTNSFELYCVLYWINDYPCMIQWQKLIRKNENIWIEFACLLNMMSAYIHFKNYKKLCNEALFVWHYYN